MGFGPGSGGTRLQYIYVSDSGTVHKMDTLGARVRDLQDFTLATTRVA